MARENYMTMAVSTTVQDMFHEFVARKGITKTAALNDMLELYMLASDEPLYLELKRKYLNVEAVKNQIADRDSTQPAPEFLFMKLGTHVTSKNVKLKGEETIQLYMQDIASRGYTWFSTESLFYGMSEQRVKQFNRKIQSGERVRILFAYAVGNDISYSADVLEVFSAKSPVPCPEPGKCPQPLVGENARIWLKLTNLARETQINASMLQISSTKRDLKSTISNSQYHFGYVSFKD